MRHALVRFVVLVTVLAIAACDDDSPDFSGATMTYTVSFDLEATDGPLGALQFDVEYRGRGGAAWVSTGGAAWCRWIVQAALHACNDKRGGDLTCAVVDTGGFTGPGPLVECSLIAADDSLTSDDFVVEVIDASSPNLDPMEAAVVVSSVAVKPENTTTTTNPDTPPREYDVVFAMTSESLGLITELQLDVTHEGVVGAWIGSRTDVDCHWLVPGDTRICNEVSNQLATCVIASMAGFIGSQPILTCGFATSEDVVEASDFSAWVVDISTAYGTPDYVYASVVSVTER
jgi:hypothetical protein